MSLIDAGSRVIKQEGLVTFLVIGVGYVYYKTIRRLLPIQEYTKFQGLKIPPEIMPMIRLFDRQLPQKWHRGLAKGESSQPESKALNQFTQSEDTIVVIGTSWGVSTAVAARQITNGKVIGYEGSQRCVEYTEKTLELNGLQENCKIYHNVVGPDDGVYDGEFGEQIHPTELPNCDFLLMDCEGAEYFILKNMTIRPRIVGVEIHPELGGFSSGSVINILLELNYEIKSCFTQDGEKISFNELKNSRDNPESSPPFVVASYEGSPSEM